MEQTVARTRLSGMVAASSRPVLSQDELDAILVANRVPDTLGRLVTDQGYTPTYDLNRAAAEGWRMKAGKVAGDFDFSADNASYSKGAVMEKCLRMESHYASKVLGTIRAEYGPESHYDSPRLIL